jgi:hypothetical protein
MEPQKHPKNPLRGWLPKEPEPHLQNNQTPINQKTTATSTKTIGRLAITTGSLALFLLIAPYYLFPELYIPKSNPAWGYAAPKTTLSGIFLAGAISLLLLSAIPVIHIIKTKTSKHKQKPYFKHAT